MTRDTKTGFTRFILSRTKLARSCFRAYLRLNHVERGFGERTAKTFARGTTRGYQDWYQHCHWYGWRDSSAAYGAARELYGRVEKLWSSGGPCVFGGSWVGRWSVGTPLIPTRRSGRSAGVRSGGSKPSDAGVRTVVFCA